MKIVYLKSKVTGKNMHSGYVKITQGRRKGDFVPVVDVRDGEAVREQVMQMNKKPMDGSKFFKGGYHRDPEDKKPKATPTKAEITQAVDEVYAVKHKAAK